MATQTVTRPVDYEEVPDLIPEEEPPPMDAKPRRANIRLCGLWKNKDGSGEYFSSWLNSSEQHPLGIIVRRNKEVVNAAKEDAYLIYFSPHSVDFRGKRLPAAGNQMLLVGTAKLVKARSGTSYLNGRFLNGFISIFRSRDPFNAASPTYFATFTPRVPATQQQSRPAVPQEMDIPF